MIPYTYLIGWSKLNVWYYGSQYAEDSHPSNLWNTYFTSSNHVKDFVIKNGNPDIIKIHKLFHTANEAKTYETQFLTRLRKYSSEFWLNKCNGSSGFMCTGHSDETKRKMSVASKGKKKSKEHSENIVKGVMRKYGKTNISQVPEVQRKIKENAIKKYGVDSWTKTENGKLKISKHMSGRIHITLDDIRKFVKPGELQSYLDAGWIRNCPAYERTVLTCPHCSKNIDNANYKRWHGDNCKMQFK